MIRELGYLKARSWVMFMMAAVLSNVAAPLLITAAGETPGAAAVAALTLALCGLIVFALRRAHLSAHAARTSVPRWSDPRLVRRTADVADPPRHPLRPRAPGLA